MTRKPLLLLLVALQAATLLAVVFVRPAPAGVPQVADFPFAVVRAYYDDQAQVQALASWREPWEVNDTAGYIVLDATPAEQQQLRDLGFRLEVDLTLTEELNRPRTALPNQGGGIPGYECYRTVEETFDTGAQLATDYPTLAEWIDIGDSWDKVTPGGPAGYDMMVLRLTNEEIPVPKPALYIFGSIHAREYVAAESATRLAEYLLQNYGTDADATWILDHHELHLVLQANPDGRKIAETGVLWRKNRNNTDGCATTFGVDLNRNFEFYWNQGGTNPNPCSETYLGSAAAPEPEVQAMQAYAYSVFPDQRDDPITATAPITSSGIFIDLHSYAREILWPWGFTSDPPPNGTGMQTLARKMGYFSTYAATQSLYATSGTTKDFMYGEFGVPAYTIEIGTAFFQQCSTYESTIWPQEMFPTLLYAAKAVRHSYIIPAGPDSYNVALSDAAVPAGVPVTLTAVVDDTRYNNSTGIEPTQNIVAAEYYIDTPDWLPGAVAHPLDPADGAFDSTIEDVTVTIDTAGLSLGQHTVYVRAQDAAGNWGVVSALYLEITEVAPTAAFTSNSPVLNGDPVEFTNTSTGGGLSFEWDFGDGSPVSTEEAPVHLYPAAGLYTVTLTATNSMGSDVFQDQVEILPNEAPAASFTMDASLVPVGQEVHFTNTSTGSDATYLWDFGDGQTSSETHPAHAYAAPGMYSVVLTATNSAGSDTHEATITVYVSLYLPLVVQQE